MTDQIRIPLTADQKRLIAEAADLNALEMTAWARSVLVLAATEQKSPGSETAETDPPLHRGHKDQETTRNPI